MNLLSARGRAAASAAVLACLLAACGGGNDDNTPPAAQTPTGPGAIAATPDSFTLAAGFSGDVLANDSLGGAAASATAVTVTPTGTLPAGVSLSTGGVVGVGAGAVAGAQPVGYQVCETAFPTNCATATATVTVVVPAAGQVSGRALDASTGLGLAGVTVSAGSVSAVTDANGNFVLEGVPQDSGVPVVFSAPNYANTTRPVDTTAGSTVQVRLVPVGTTAQLPIAAGGTVSLAGSSARLVLPANALQRADGSIPTGNVTVALTPLDPASDSTVMPGDYTTLVGGAIRHIESFGALDVVLTDSTGARLNLRPGFTANLRIPVGTRNAAPPANSPLYFFDEASGRWVEEGSAAQGGSGAAAYYEGTVSHFTTWNADQVYETVQVNGCIADANGARVAGASVEGDGIDYSGTSSARSDAGGNFSIPVRRGSHTALTGVFGGQLTNTLQQATASVDITLPACLSLSTSGAGITMKLTWGAAPVDLDSHLFAPDGSEVSYRDKGSLTASPYASLDIDDTSSFGPEVVTVTKLMVGTYKYSIRNFTGYDGGPIAASGARVELNLPGRAPELFAPPTGGESSSTQWWNLFEFTVDASCNITINRVQRYSGSAPEASALPQALCTPP